MGIINDLQNSICNAISKRNPDINFTMDEIIQAVYPFVFFYITNCQVMAREKTSWNNVRLTCVVEYQESEENLASVLWNKLEILKDSLTPYFTYNETHLVPLNIDYKVVEKVLQMTFDLDFYIKENETAELMQELDVTYNLNRRIK